MSKKKNPPPPKKEEQDGLNDDVNDIRFVHLQYSNAMLTVFLGDRPSDTKNIITYY